jgi:AraC family transcriptional regulator of adaptative response / DNA-3-methyladenine glycosylase II
MHLILDGELNEHNERELAARLGVSPRHLSRLFQLHLGVTPDELARSSRAHFARRLLDDTDLTITDIAFASGFGSLRQFNRTMLATFRATPLELRARRRKSDRLIADGGLLVRMNFLGSLDWDSMIGFFRTHAIRGVEYADPGVYRRTITVAGDLGALEIRPGGTGELLLLAHLPHWRYLIHVVRRVRRIFNLDADLQRPTQRRGPQRERCGSADAAPLERIAGTWDPFEVVVANLIRAHVDPDEATEVAARLVDAYGVAAPGLRDLGLSHIFPAPEALAGAELERIGLTEQGASVVRAFAHEVAEGRICLEGNTALKGVVDELASVPGIDPSTVESVVRRMGLR